MSLKSPSRSRAERHLTLENLESRQMMSGTTLASVQQDTAYLANAVLRDEPVTLLNGEKEFNGSTMECIADSPVFTDGSFTLETQIRVHAMKQQSIITKYDSGVEDKSFHFCMLNTGQLQIDVYGAPNGKNYLTFQTTGAPLTVGQWHTVRASFDLEHRQMAIMVDGQDIPGVIIQTGEDVTALYDSKTAVRVGGRRTGSGDGNILDADVRDARYFPIDSFEEKAATPQPPVSDVAVDAVIAKEEAVLPLTEAEATTTKEQQLTATAIDAILRAEPITLLSGTKEFNGSTMECIADSPVFTDGSFTIEAMVKPDVIKSQTIVSKYDSRVGDKSFFLGMLGDGRLQFVVYGDNGVYRMYETNSAPLSVGILQRLRASFDIDTQKMTIMIDGKEIPMTLVEGSQEVKKLHDGASPVQVAASSFGGGPTNYWDGPIEDMTFFPVDRYGIPAPAAVVDAAVTEKEAVLPLTEAEANALKTTQETTSETVQTVLTAKDTVVLQSEWTREQEEFRAAEGRTAVLLNGLAEDRDTLNNLQEDLADKRTALTAKETSLKQCQDALEPLAAEARRLTDLTTSLTDEQQSLPERIAALEKQTADGQKALQDTILARDATEQTLASTRQQAYQGEKEYSYQLKIYQQNWRNKALLNKVNAIREKINNLQKQAQLLQNQFTTLSKKAVECQNSLSSATQELTVLQKRQTALPAELSGAITALETAEARLGTLPGEETRLISEIAALRASVSMQATEADLLSQRIIDSKNNLTTALLTESHEWQDVEQMRRTVDAALLTVLEEDSATDGTPQLQVKATEDTQSLSLTERQLQQYETRMAAANERLAVCETALTSAQQKVQALEQTIATANETIATADSTIQKAALEAQLEQSIGTSSFRIEGLWPNRIISLRYQNIPEGYDAITWGSGFEEREVIHAGSGTIDFGIPLLGVVDAQIGIVRHGTKEVVGKMVDFRILKGYIRENVDDRSITLPSLAVTRTINAETITDQEKQKASATAVKAEIETYLPQAQAVEAQALSDWQIARRETIAYAGITSIESEVTPNSNGYQNIHFSVHYRSPDTASRMEVFLNGARVRLVELQHPAGELDAVFSCDYGMENWSGDLEFRYSSRNEKEGMRQVDSATASFNARESVQNAAHVYTTFSDVESHDTGRLVDTPLPYSLKLMSTNGPNAVLHFSSPDDESVITSSTGGIYGQNSYSHSGGTSTGVTLLTLNPNKPGRYFYSLIDHNGTTRDVVWVEWDGTTLTLVDQEAQWTSDEATNMRTASLDANNPDASPATRIATILGEEAAETMEQERLELLISRQMNLTSIAVSGMNLELGRVQAKNFYERSALFVNMETMHECFFTVHPDWRPENVQATVMRMWQDGGCNGPSGDTRDWLNDVILDVMGRYDRDLNVYAAAMAEIMEKGVKTCLAIRQGQLESPLLFELDQLITARGYWEAVGRLSGIGVKLPTRQQVITACKLIVDDEIVRLLFTQSENARLIANFDLRQQYNATWAAEHGGLTNVSVLNVRATVAGGYTEKEVSKSEARRLKRAADLVLEARKGNDTRAQMSVVISDDQNVQRERQLANGTIQITITTAEAEKIATEVDEAIAETGGDATAVGEKMLVTMNGNLMPDLSWATLNYLRKTTETEEQETSVEDYSTLPVTSENQDRREFENMILSQIAEHFPLDLSARWKNTIGSPYHLGNAQNAVDLNMLTGGNTDYGQPISAPVDGKVVGQPNVSIGSITLEFTTSINGQLFTWHMRFLHLPLEEENGKVFVRQRENMDPSGRILFEKEISDGMEIAKDEQFGVVGKNGTAFSHLHLETLDSQGRMIDLRHLFDSSHLNIPSRAADESGKEWATTWDDTVHSWVNAEQGIIFVQDGNTWSDDENNVWVTWNAEEAQRKRVVWVHKLDDGRIIDAWLSFDHSQKWNSQNRAWETI